MRTLVPHELSLVPHELFSSHELSVLAKVLIYDSEPRLHARSCEQHLHKLKVPTSATGEAQAV